MSDLEWSLVTTVVVLICVLIHLIRIQGETSAMIERERRELSDRYPKKTYKEIVALREKEWVEKRPMTDFEHN